MKKILTALTTGFIIAYASALSAEETEKQYYAHYLGVSASSLSGVGLSYAYIFHPDYMFKICGVYTETNDQSSDSSDYTRDIWWNAGTEIQRFLFTIPSDNLVYTGYALAGGSYWYSKYEDTAWMEDNDVEKKWMAGVAMGIRIIFYERIAINLEFGYQFGWDLVDDTRNTGIAGGAGAYFAF